VFNTICCDYHKNDVETIYILVRDAVRSSSAYSSGCVLGNGESKQEIRSLRGMTNMNHIRDKHHSNRGLLENASSRTYDLSGGLNRSFGSNPGGRLLKKLWRLMVLGHCRKTWIDLYCYGIISRDEMLRRTEECS